VLGNQNQFTVSFTNEGNIIESSITISPTIMQTVFSTGNATPTDNFTIVNSTADIFATNNSTTYNSTT
jgi:hypothetical protein